MAKKALKDKAWKLFSIYIKLRDADANGLCTCCTCGKEIQFDSNNCHAGHFVAGRSGSVLFDEKIVHAQCDGCNLFRSGEQGKYVLFMKKKYGHTDEDVNQLLDAKKMVRKFTDDDMYDLIAAFYSLINVLLSTKFKHDDFILERVKIKIKKYGMARMLNVGVTLGMIK